MFEFTFEVAGEKQIARRFTRLDDAVEDMTPAFKEITKSFYAGEKRQFETEGGWGSGGWLPLSPAYEAWKDPTLSIMELSGDLKASLTGMVPPNTAGNIEIIESNQLILGTDIDYAIYHQSNAPRTKLPQRKVIELPESERKKWTSIIHEHIWKTQR